MAVPGRQHRCADCGVAGGCRLGAVPGEKLAVWPGRVVAVAGVRSARRQVPAGRPVHGAPRAARQRTGTRIRAPAHGA